VVHPGPGHWDDSLVNVLVARGTALSQGSSEGRPGIVHRLDRDTSGLLLVAKTDRAHQGLTRMIEQRTVERVYAALAWGHFAKSPVEIEAPITRNPTDRKRMTVLAGGRHAVTHAAVVARFAQTDLLRLTLDTGRTHQIRVHLAHVGHPVVGDAAYARGGSRRVTPSERRAAEQLEALAPERAAGGVAPEPRGAAAGGGGRERAGHADHRRGGLAGAPPARAARLQRDPPRHDRAARGRRGEEGPGLHGGRSRRPPRAERRGAGPPAGAPRHRSDAGARRGAPRRPTLRGSRHRRATDPHLVFLGRACEPHCPRV